MRESFEHFYLTKVGLGEGCGCAEHVTRIREIDSYAESRVAPYCGDEHRPADLRAGRAPVPAPRKKQPQRNSRCFNPGRKRSSPDP